MRIPKEMKVGGHNYKILLLSPKEMEEYIPDKLRSYVDDLDTDISPGLFGLNLPMLNVIFINKEIPQSQKEEALLHELIHAVDPVLEETVVQSLAHGLYQVLKDNNLLK